MMGAKLFAAPRQKDIDAAKEPSVVRPLNEHWREMATAPQDGTTIHMRGRWPHSEEMTEIDGLYEAGGYTEGWVDVDRYNVFYPDAWRPTTDERMLG